MAIVPSKIEIPDIEEDSGVMQASGHSCLCAVCRAGEVRYFIRMPDGVMSSAEIFNICMEWCHIRGFFCSLIRRSRILITSSASRCGYVSSLVRSSPTRASRIASHDPGRCFFLPDGASFEESCSAEGKRCGYASESQFLINAQFTVIPCRSMRSSLLAMLSASAPWS